MYNLLITADDSAWNKSHYLYDKSRFLEYTNEDISSIFKPLTNKSKKILTTYPSLFMYEGKKSDARVGYLTAIKERGRNLLIEYKMIENIPPIPFASIKPILLLLDIRDWEMNRTHWAVKDEDLFNRLVSENLIDKTYAISNNKYEKPISNKNNKNKIKSVQEFIAKILSLEENNSFEVFYRGHSNKKKYKLVPSIFRKDEKGNYIYLDNEHILYRELIVSNSADFISDNYTLDKLVRMQHYSLPTRLLDITSNPLIALYFACKTKCNEEGEVILFSIKKTDIKYFDSNTASCLANLARLPKREKDSIDFKNKEFNKQVPIKRLTHFIKEEKSFFEPKIIPDDLRKIICVKSKQSNDRISSQSGAFLLYGIDAILNEKGTNDIKVTRITVINKEKILEELDLLNINESTVFPYIENSAKYVASKYKFNK